MIEATLVSFGVIFAAELGDKSQLLALALAARYRPWPVLGGIAISTALVHALSVGVGALIADELPTTAINIIAGIAFFGFALWTLRGDHLSEAENERTRRGGRSALIAAGVAFFIAELGDKTMLATMTLAARGNIFGVWLGSTAGMVVADAIAIAVVAHVGSRLPDRMVRIVAAALFVAFGALLIVDAVRG